MHSFSVSSIDPSNAVRLPLFPALEAGNISFPNGKYTVECEPGDDKRSFIIKHRIEGAPLIARLLEENKALYVCTVSSPKSSYRKTHKSESEKQVIEWDNNDLGEPPLLTPMIVSAIPINGIQLDATKDGVHKIWHNQTITLKKGSRLALGILIQIQSSSILSLLSFEKDKSLGKGEFYVVPETEGNFRFLVRLNPELHSFLRRKGDEIRTHIITNIVTACLALLQREFKEDWESYHNLKIFADHLENKGLAHWSDEGSFYPERVATQLHPHNIPEISYDE